MPSGQGVIGYRRNGKKQACEPCRKGKLACDHGSPFCGRCVRRKTTERCIYHPAPMTKVRPPTTSPTDKTISDTTPLSAPGVTGCFPATLNQRLLTSPHAEIPRSQVREKAPYPGRHPEGGVAGTASGVEFVRPRNKSESWKDAVYQRSAKYYGPTSFSAVFLEHRATASEDLLELGEDVRKHPGAWKFGQPLCMCFRLYTPPFIIISTSIISLPPTFSSEKNGIHIFGFK